MRANEIAPIFREITRINDDLAFRKRLLFKFPLDGLLRGIHFDPSGFDKRQFQVTAFIMPLCVPTDHYHMSFGIDILVPGQSWSMDMPDLLPRLLDRIETDALPFLDKVPTLRAFVTAVDRYNHNPHAPKAAAYALARLGEMRPAIDMIEAYVPKLDLTSHWQQTIADESYALRHLLIYQPEKAATKLAYWETETIRNLGLERFR